MLLSIHAAGRPFRVPVVTQFRGTSWQLGIHLHQRNRGLRWWTHHASLWRGMLHTSEASPSPLPLGRPCGTEGNLGVWSRRPWCYGGLPPPCNGVGGVGFPPGSAQRHWDQHEVTERNGLTSECRPPGRHQFCSPKERSFTLVPSDCLKAKWARRTLSVVYWTRV